MAEALAVAAPAKLTLYLHVTGRRRDGRHALDALVAFLDWGDRVNLRPATTRSLTVTGPHAAGVPAGPANLAWQAAELAQQLWPLDTELALAIDKRIPAAAGLGGGSADAAAVLRGHAALAGGTLDSPTVRAAAGELGADIPSCLGSTPVRMHGVGERLTTAASPPPLGVVVAQPGIAVPTGQVFAARTGPYSNAPAIDWAVPRTPAAFRAALGNTRNDLAEPAGRVASAASAAVDALAALPGARLARLAGSGASAFALFADGAAAEAAGARLAACRPAWTVRTGSFAGPAFARPRRLGAPA